MDFAVEDEVQLVVGFEDGTIEVRKHRKGTLVHSVTLQSNAAVAKVFYYDYRNNGNKQLIAVG